MVVPNIVYISIIDVSSGIICISKVGPLYHLSFDASDKMYWSRMAEYEPFQMVMSNLLCTKYEIKGLTGSVTCQNKRMC